jgi:hypothetical protein
MTPLDLAQRACKHANQGELDWHWNSLWMNDTAMRATIGATMGATGGATGAASCPPRKDATPEPGAIPGTPPAPREAGGTFCGAPPVAQ